MDIVAGHFGYLEYYSSSKLSFPFIGEITSMARAAVKGAKEKDLLLPAYNASGNEPIPTRANGNENTNIFSVDEVRIFTRKTTNRD